MQNPLRTLLYGLFVAPLLGALQSLVDWFGNGRQRTRRIDSENIASRAIDAPAGKSGE
jgi:hypothetical protein